VNRALCLLGRTLSVVAAIPGWLVVEGMRQLMPDDTHDVIDNYEPELFA
jgi:hypothetical protein